jgi:hypothetical protein
MPFYPMEPRQGYYQIPGGLTPRQVGDPVLIPRSTITPPGGGIFGGHGGPYISAGSTLTVADDYSIFGLFDNQAAPVPLSIWLRTPLIKVGMTVETVIRQVAHKDGGAHYDPNQTSSEMNDLGRLQGHVVAAIAEGITPQLRKQLASMPA